MCLSPHEMSAEQLQANIDKIRDRLESGTLAEYLRRTYEARLEKFEELLKEKAEAGEMV